MLRKVMTKMYPLEPKLKLKLKLNKLKLKVTLRLNKLRLKLRYHKLPRRVLMRILIHMVAQDQPIVLVVMVIMVV